MNSAGRGKRKRPSNACKEKAVEFHTPPNKAAPGESDLLEAPLEGAAEAAVDFTWSQAVSEGACSAGSQSGAASVVPPLGASTSEEPQAKPADEKRKEARARKVDEERKVNDILACFQRRAEKTASPKQERSISASASSSSGCQPHN